MGKVCCVIIPWNIPAQQQLFSTSLCPSFYQQTKCAADTCERGVNELYNYFECNNLNCIYIKWQWKQFNSQQWYLLVSPAYAASEKQTTRIQQNISDFPASISGCPADPKFMSVTYFKREAKSTENTQEVCFTKASDMIHKHKLRFTNVYVQQWIVIIYPPKCLCSANVWRNYLIWQDITC